ncbi:hypothetical protein NW755_014180 [Fusarium falciforme]|uniref:Major facilitator superfamily (MFS) profile domain-containing protein n=1 Tax=Fusarium falciforme TaxID=195108 RepID=A0A9W8QUN0_9HYPO|nr:hypothetical protein NW755_014180 [Fusarium falciforme]
MIKEPPRAWTKSQMMIYAFSIVGFFCSTMNGYDGSLINNLLQNPWFQEKYGIENSGFWTGLVSAMYQIGGVVALPFTGPCIDGFGRRAGMFAGAITIVIALYMTLWFTGAIIAAGSARGGLDVGGDYSWRLITWLQALFSGLICILCWFIPESPRWLYVRNKQDQAKKILSEYHGNGNPESAWVTLQMHEYDEYLNLNGSDKRWWDYRTLVQDRTAVYRLCCSVAIPVFAQWAGNAVLSYFLGSVLETAGYTSAIAQANITLINNCQQFFWAILGALLVDKVGRRPLLMFSYMGCAVVWLGMTVASSVFEKSHYGDDKNGKPLYSNHQASKATLALIFIFGAIYSVGVTPLQALYPVEVLSFEMRAKGMAVSNLAVNAAGLLNQFAWPVAMKGIKWRTYIIFTIWCLIQFTIVYVFIPETKGRTLEELDDIFKAKRPVKASLKKKTVAITNNGNIVGVDGI